MCFSPYSLISILIIDESDPKIFLANVFTVCVLPVPVEPKNKNTPCGLFGSFSPAAFLRKHLLTLATTSSCPMISILRFFSKSKYFLAISSSSDFSSGTSTLRAITFSTADLSIVILFSSFEFNSVSLSCSCFSCDLILTAPSKFCAFNSFAFSSPSSCNFFSKLFISGDLVALALARAPTSSKRSIALSGKNLSVMNLPANLTQATMASSV